MAAKRMSRAQSTVVPVIDETEGKAGPVESTVSTTGQVAEQQMTPIDKQPEQNSLLLSVKLILTPASIAKVAFHLERNQPMLGMIKEVIALGESARIMALEQWTQAQVAYKSGTRQADTFKSRKNEFRTLLGAAFYASKPLVNPNDPTQMWDMPFDIDEILNQRDLIDRARKALHYRAIDADGTRIAGKVPFNPNETQQDRIFAELKAQSEARVIDQIKATNPDVKIPDKVLSEQVIENLHKRAKSMAGDAAMRDKLAQLPADAKKQADSLVKTYGTVELAVKYVEELQAAIKTLEAIEAAAKAAGEKKAA